MELVYIRFIEFRNSGFLKGCFGFRLDYWLYLVLMDGNICIELVVVFFIYIKYYIYIV